MKKALSILLLLTVILFAFTACGHEHVFGEWTVTSEATCTAEGSRERVCECGEVEAEVIPMAEHNYEEKILKEKTCAEDGQVEKTCADCGNKVTETLTSTGHDFSAATVFAPKTCKSCGETEGEALSKAIEVGEEVKLDDKHSFIVEKVMFTSSLSEKKGIVTRKYSSGYVCALKLNFINLSVDAFEDSGDRLTEAKLLYQDVYNYEGKCWCPEDDIVPLGQANVYVVFEVPESMGNDSENSIYTTFTVDGTAYSLIVQKSEAAQQAEADEAAVNTEAEIKVGDVRTDNENFQFELKDVFFTSTLSEKKGIVNYKYSDGFYLVVKLDFKNLATEAFEDSNSGRISDMALKFDGQYDYEGKYWCPGNDIVPLANGNVYIVYEVAETVESADGSLVASFKIDGNEFTVNYR